METRFVRTRQLERGIDRRDGEDGRKPARFSVFALTGGCVDAWHIACSFGNRAQRTTLCPQRDASASGGAVLNTFEGPGRRNAETFSSVDPGCHRGGSRRAGWVCTVPGLGPGRHQPDSLPGIHRRVVECRADRGESRPRHAVDAGYPRRGQAVCRRNDALRSRRGRSEGGLAPNIPGGLCAKAAI